MSRAIAATLSALVLAGALAIPVLPCVDSESARPLQIGRFAAYGLGSLVCHQKPERSLRSCGRQWPVCGRCAGLYLGAAVGVIAGFAFVRIRGASRDWRRRLLLAAAPTAVLWLVEMTGFWDPGTPIRAWVSGLLGLAGGMWLAAVAQGD
jgi:uncharacterized membrane protein